LESASYSEEHERIGHGCTLEHSQAKVEVHARAQFNEYFRTFGGRTGLLQTTEEIAEEELFQRMTPSLSRDETELWLKTSFGKLNQRSSLWTNALADISAVEEMIQRPNLRFELLLHRSFGENRNLGSRMKCANITAMVGPDISVFLFA
jgi:hypothetical protein